ncbi:YHS domain-containing protein [Nocardiopsis chromatogenes]|uniref:YHS domain-containing protein n=1 Tax=Nocardiopsis chromatogenes TaxID=280239 RepID=UPI00036CE470|nr:YHS domain-containing protein [Nocardiopsis chromatogenes]
MFLIEIAHPEGALSDGDREMLAAEIVSGLTGAGEEEAPEETMRRARRMTHVAFRGLGAWRTGDGPVPDGAAPPVWVTVTLPEAWRDESARHSMGWIRRAVRKVDRAHGWERTGGDLWINVVGVADGCIGLNGRAATADTVLEYMTEEFHAAMEEGRIEVPEGRLLDPVCGMQVRNGPRALTLEHGGTLYGFCAQGCLDVYAKRNGIEAPAA